VPGQTPPEQKIARLSGEGTDPRTPHPAEETSRLKGTSRLNKVRRFVSDPLPTPPVFFQPAEAKTSAYDKDSSWSPGRGDFYLGAWLATLHAHHEYLRPRLAAVAAPSSRLLGCPDGQACCFAVLLGELSRSVLSDPATYQDGQRLVPMPAQHPPARSKPTACLLPLGPSCPPHHPRPPDPRKDRSGER
jgi:hypothetical protein